MSMTFNVSHDSGFLFDFLTTVTQCPPSCFVEAFRYHTLLRNNSFGLSYYCNVQYPHFKIDARISEHRILNDELPTLRHVAMVSVDLEWNLSSYRKYRDI
ncbi:hypothetical protein CEXT_262391 [Caerostris extrusa]|uniref:Uncharacterized protein n=1 Tax=Caerostris extrusa TaxID=172846 RepID=A0AAV4QGT8_CAEEX|nr:hypothetical protein CEXT_262391 [Caerostris extrusa]